MSDSIDSGAELGVTLSPDPVSRVLWSPWSSRATSFRVETASSRHSPGQPSPLRLMRSSRDCSRITPTWSWLMARTQITLVRVRRRNARESPWGDRRDLRPGEGSSARTWTADLVLPRVGSCSPIPRGFEPCRDRRSRGRHGDQAAAESPTRMNRCPCIPSRIARGDRPNGTHFDSVDMRSHPRTRPRHPA